MTFALRLYNSYNHAHVPYQHMWPSLGPWPNSKCSKTVEVGCARQELKSCKREITTDEIQKKIARFLCVCDQGAAAVGGGPHMSWAAGRPSPFPGPAGRRAGSVTGDGHPGPATDSDEGTVSVRGPPGPEAP